MKTFGKILLTVTLVLMTVVSFSGCAVHAEASMGAGTGTKYAASMSNRRGVGSDFPADAKEISQKKETKIGRAARDD